MGEYTGTTLGITYFYGLSSNQPLDLIEGGASFFYDHDALQSTTTITDASGNVAAAYRYDAYGKATQASDTVGNPFRFTGLASDTTSGLIYARARWYDPSTGRFLTPDPLGGGARAYAYAGDNPTNNVDPSGKAFVYMGLLSEPEGGMGDIGVGCNEDELRTNGCESRAPQIDLPALTHPQLCMVDWTMVAASIVLGMLGVYADLHSAENLGHLFQIVNLAGPDTYGVFSTAFSNGAAFLIAVGSFTLDLLQLIWSELIENLVIGFFMWLDVASNFAFDFVPGVFEAKLILVGLGAAMNVAGVYADNCGPGQQW